MVLGIKEEIENFAKLLLFLLINRYLGTQRENKKWREEEGTFHMLLFLFSSFPLAEMEDER